MEHGVIIGNLVLEVMSLKCLVTWRYICFEIGKSTSWHKI